MSKLINGSSSSDSSDSNSSSDSSDSSSTNSTNSNSIGGFIIKTCDNVDNKNNKLPELSYESIQEVFSYIHHHYQYIITKNGLDFIICGSSSRIDRHVRPAKLSIYAILNARYMNDFKDVLLGQSFRERTWPIVKSSRAYDDVVPWLQANRCPYMYDAITEKTADVYGISRYHSGEVYEGSYKDGSHHGQGKFT